MKAIRQRFHKQIVRQYKSNHFATIRKQVLQLQQFQSLYSQIIDNNQKLSTIIQKFGYILFLKHINQILDYRLYDKLYQNQSYFIQNLNFVIYLIDAQALPHQQINFLIMGLSQILKNNNLKLSIQSIKDIFQIVQKILQTQKYIHTAIQSIKNQQIINQLYKITISKELNQYFFKIIQFCKILKDTSITHVNYSQLLHCVQIHILTTDRIQQLYTSYSLLGDIFPKLHNQTEQLYQYGSILNKTMKDIFIDKLIDPISYFIIKAINNSSVIKLMNSMNCAQVFFNVILEKILTKNASISIFGNQSMWSIFKKIISSLIKSNKTQQIAKLDWKQLKQKLQNHNSIKYPYVKVQIYQTLNEISKAKINFFFQDLIHFYQKELEQKLQDVQI